MRFEKAKLTKIDLHLKHLQSTNDLSYGVNSQDKGK